VSADRGLSNIYTNKAVIDRRLRPRCCHLRSYFKRHVTSRSSPERPLSATGIPTRQAEAACEPHCLSLAATSSSLSLCANTTPSINRKYVTYHYATKKDQATAIGNTQKNGEVRTCGPKDMIADRQTHRHAQYNSPLPWGRASHAYDENAPTAADGVAQ